MDVTRRMATMQPIVTTIEIAVARRPRSATQVTQPGSANGRPTS